MAVRSPTTRAVLAVGIADRRRPALREPGAAHDWSFLPFSRPVGLTISGIAAVDVWPRLAAAARRAPPLPDTTVTVRSLVLGGDPSLATPFLDAQVFGPRLGTNVRVVELRNTCKSERRRPYRVYERHLLPDDHPRVHARARRRVHRTSCAGRIPALHTTVLHRRAPRTLVSCPDPGDAARRAATIAATRSPRHDPAASYRTTTTGLRGGHVHGQGRPHHAHGVRFAGADAVTARAPTFPYATAP